MTNEDIILALKCHSIHQILHEICKECPYYNVVDCYDTVIWNAIEALKNQKGEAE